jgi:hypothetical protein
MRVDLRPSFSERVLCTAFLAVAVACSPPEAEDATRREADKNTMEQELIALGYLDSYPIAPEDEDKLGVESLGADSNRPGMHLLTEKHRIRLIDMQGEVVREILGRDIETYFLGEAEYLPDGTLLVIDTDSAILWFDRDWKLQRRLSIPAHHDITFADGEIFVLTRRLEQVRHGDGIIPLLVDYVALLSLTGEPLRELSLYEVAGKLISEAAIRAVRESVEKAGDPVVRGRAFELKRDGSSAFVDSPYDVFHANYVHVAAREVPGVCRRGDLLVSFRNLDLIAFIRPEESRIVWSWGPGELEGQHNPVLLDSGNIMIFDNGSNGRGWSRVVEMDPRTKTIAWEYHGEPKSSFYSGSSSAVQVLQNGNVVITSAEQGRVFEVTRDKEIVWEYWNSFKPIKKRNPETLWQVVRGYWKEVTSVGRRRRFAIQRSHRVTRELALPER